MMLQDAVRRGAVLVALLVAGCGGSATPSESAIKEQPLVDVGRMYRIYTEQKHKPPTKLVDLKSYIEMGRQGYVAINEGKVEVIWGVKLDDLAEEGSKDSADEVLAYDKKAPTDGGPVLLKNRTVKTMTADEFKAAPKAQGIAAPTKKK